MPITDSQSMSTSQNYIVAGATLHDKTPIHRTFYLSIITISIIQLKTQKFIFFRRTILKFNQYLVDYTTQNKIQT